MRVLVLTPTFFPIMGGAELGIYEICRQLAAAHAVRVLTPVLSARRCADYGIEGDAHDLSRFELARYPDRLNLKDVPGQWLLRGLIPPFSLSMAGAALRHAGQFRPDALLAFYALPSGLAAAWVRKRRRVPVLLSLIGRDVPGPGIPRLWGRYVRWAARSADRTLFISDYCRREAGVAGSSADDVVPFGVDSAPFAGATAGGEWRERLGIPRSARVLLAVQRLEPWKRVDVLLRAQALVLRETDTFLVIGGKGPELERLRDLARDLGISARVLFAGYIADRELPFYYAMADLFVFHSTYETFCLSLLQAMAAGKPIVSVRSTAIPELVHHGENGLLVAPGDAAALARSVLELLADAAMRERFAAESRRRVKTGYGWETIARRYMSALEQCLRGRAESLPAGGAGKPA